MEELLEEGFDIVGEAEKRVLGYLSSSMDHSYSPARPLSGTVENVRFGTAVPKLQAEQTRCQHVASRQQATISLLDHNEANPDYSRSFYD